MKSLHLALTGCLLALTLGAAHAAPRVGQPAPDFSVIDTAGQTHSLADFSGQTVILEWTNHDCPFVKKHYVSDNMQQLQRRYTENGAVWLTVISSAPGKQGHVSPDQADALTRDRHAAPTAVLLDESGDMGRAYDARTTPHMYVIDADGVLRFMGGIDSNPSADPADIPGATPYLANAARAVLDGHTPDPAVTRPYGCTVKY
ncbi:thioredoxin family protein [Isoalcanivorax indicus]|uniref:thioredoxin family protein n=1 Tax=Isoalcanivorax indicus TaxID=2202653 RepID=UPI000DB971B6|nr:thioredoxin family protein [Isoalcanivorax indicus]